MFFKFILISFLILFILLGVSVVYVLYKIKTDYPNKIKNSREDKKINEILKEGENIANKIKQFNNYFK
jgi:peptidoglycan hydrolase CwlO-like protein